ncbi:hypothetical protein BH10PSE19_BH10PSE19_09830 [soil metagenome]
MHNLIKVAACLTGLAIAGVTWADTTVYGTLRIAPLTGLKDFNAVDITVFGGGYGVLKDKAVFVKSMSLAGLSSIELPFSFTVKGNNVPAPSLYALIRPSNMNGVPLKYYTAECFDFDNVHEASFRFGPFGGDQNDFDRNVPTCAPAAMKR